MASGLVLLGLKKVEHVGMIYELGSDRWYGMGWIAERSSGGEVCGSSSIMAGVRSRE